MIKYVVPDMPQTFGVLTFSGEEEVDQRRINGKMTVRTRTYNLFSTVQRADDVSVRLPAAAGDKHFDYEDEVMLINPRIIVEGYRVENRGYVNYIMYADDMVKVERKKQNG